MFQSKPVCCVLFKFRFQVVIRWFTNQNGRMAIKSFPHLLFWLFLKISYYQFQNNWLLFYVLFFFFQRGAYSNVENSNFRHGNTCHSATRRREKREGKRTVLENTLPTTITSQYQLELPNKTENPWRWLSWPTYSVVPYPKRHDTAITPPQNKKKISCITRVTSLRQG